MNIANLKNPLSSFPLVRGKQQPIVKWLDMIHLPDEVDSLQELRGIYREHYPMQGELIYTGACEFTCQHCVYPPDYAKANRNISLDKWETILRELHTLGIETFVYGGRSVTRAGVKLLKTIRTLYPKARIGLIDNGISIVPFQEEIVALQLDWIDISLDGLERDHDRQRGRQGSFQAGLKGALWLKEQDAAPKVNILACLTTINRHSIIPMIREINAKGFKNFFVTPVTIVKNNRPDAALMVAGAAFVEFIRELEEALETLDDAWIELNMFGAEYVSDIIEHYPDLWNGFHPEHDHLSRQMSKNSSEFMINYYPSSLTGIREFIINTNGDVIFPKVMAKGEIPKREIAGNLLEKRALNIIRQLPDSQQFEFYYNELLDEQHSLKVMKWE